MKRLTSRDEYGNADIIGVDSAELQLHLKYKELNLVTDALNKLAGYEDTGYTPIEIKKLALAVDRSDEIQRHLKETYDEVCIEHKLEIEKLQAELAKLRAALNSVGLYDLPCCTLGEHIVICEKYNNDCQKCAYDFYLSRAELKTTKEGE